MFKKVNKTISLLRKLQNNLHRAPLVTIYMANRLIILSMKGSNRFNIMQYLL